MGQARLGNLTFRLDPESVRWDFTIKASDTKTIGGKVVQVFGVDLGDMEVTGSFGQGGVAEQMKTLTALNALGTQMMSQSRTKASVPPVRFLYPPRKWDFLVYLKAFTQPGARGSVQVSPDITNPKWSLTLFIAEDNANVRKVAQDAYIARLAAGLGWRLTEFNGSNPTDGLAAVQEAGGLQQYFVNILDPGSRAATSGGS